MSVALLYEAPKLQGLNEKGGLPRNCRKIAFGFSSAQNWSFERWGGDEPPAICLQAWVAHVHRTYTNAPNPDGEAFWQALKNKEVQYFQCRRGFQIPPLRQSLADSGQFFPHSECPRPGCTR